MDEYFLTKKAVEIILDNLNDHFVKCLVSLSIQARYADNTKLIIGIFELVNTYLTTRRNDLLSSCIKYTNKSYYLHLSDSLFRLIQTHLTINNDNKYLFINDLITKYNNPIISCVPCVPSSSITRNVNDNTRTRFNSFVNYANDSSDNDEEDNKETKDAGTLFKGAYDRLKASKTLRIDMKDIKDIELSNLNKNDLL